MQIGQFKNVSGTLFGHVATADIHFARLGLKPVQSNHERAPAYEVMTLSPGKRWVQIGALWPAAMKKTGEIFFQGSIDDPSMIRPLPIALFGNEDDGFAVAWNRPRRKRPEMIEDAEDADTETAGDPFGESDPTEEPAKRRSSRKRKADSFEGNANEDGTLNDSVDDDEIPF